jgi:MFS family permease
METPAEHAVYDRPERSELISTTMDTPGIASPADSAQVVADAQPFNTRQAIRYSVANFGSSNFYMLFNTAMPLYLDTYHLDTALIGLIANERSLVGALIQPIVGRISDRTRTPLGRRRPFFLIGVPLVSLALLLLALHPPFWLMLGVMSVAAFFLAVAVDPYLALMADLFPPAQRGRVGGFTGLANALGAITFSLLAVLLWAHYEFLVFALVIILLLGAWGFTFFTVKEPPLPVGPRAEPAARRSAREHVRELLQHHAAAKYTLAMMLFWMGNGGATPYVTLFGKHVLGASDSDAFLLPLMYIAVTALLAVPAGMLADRIGKKAVLTIGLVIYGIGAILGSQSPNLLVAAIALGVIGLGNACTSVLVALLTDMVPRRQTAELVGVFSAVTSFTQPLGAMLAGAVVDLVTQVAGGSTGYRWSFIFAGVVILLGAAVLQTVHPDRAVQAV